MTFSEIIKAERAKHNLDQKHFAKKIGVAKSTLSKWENGKRFPAPHSVMKISGRLGWAHEQTLDLIFELENIPELSELEELVWQASLRVGRLGYKDKDLAELIGIGTRTLRVWRSTHMKKGAEVNQKFIDRLNKVIEQTDDELEKSLESWKVSIEDDELVKPTKLIRRRRRTEKERIELHKKRKRVLDKYPDFEKLTDDQLAEIQEAYGII